MRRLLLAIALLLALTTSAQADGDPASDVLVFKAYFLPYAPQTPADAEQKLNIATDAADRAGYPIRVAVIAGTGDLGIVPQYLGKPQEYSKFLNDELKYAYQGGLLIVMSDGYGLAGVTDKAVTARLATLPKPASNDPADLATAGADAVVALAAAAGKKLDLTAPAPANTAQTTASHPTAAAGSGGGGSNSTAIVLIAGGSVGLLVALVGLFWWVRRAPEDDPAPDAG
jgi:hypothetical protein